MNAWMQEWTTTFPSRSNRNLLPGRSSACADKAPTRLADRRIFCTGVGESAAGVACAAPDVCLINKA